MQPSIREQLLAPKVGDAFALWLWPTYYGDITVISVTDGGIIVLERQLDKPIVVARFFTGPDTLYHEYRYTADPCYVGDEKQVAFDDKAEAILNGRTPE